MAKQVKNEDSSLGLIFLFLLLLGAVGYVYMYEKNKTDKNTTPKTEKKEELKYNEDDYKKIYNQMSSL